jgi:hypothetical protein
MFGSVTPVVVFGFEECRNGWYWECDEDTNWELEMFPTELVQNSPAGIVYGIASPDESDAQLVRTWYARISSEHSVGVPQMHLCLRVDNDAVNWGNLHAYRV